MAKEFAERYLGEKDDITINLTNIYVRAKSEIDIQINKVKEKDAKIDMQRAKHRAMSANQKGRFVQSHTYGKNNKPSVGAKPNRGSNLIGISGFNVGGNQMSSQQLHNQALAMAISPTKNDMY